jgi:uncharacterized protein (DUF1015 family)
VPTAPDDATAPAEQPGSREGGLVVAPFRGVRYVADRVSDLAAVTSPPYDVIDPDDATHLEELDPHNVVRLILPRDPQTGAGEAGGGRYAHAADLLARWRADGVLARDTEPALYVYEQSGRGLLQRGVLAAVELRDPADRVVLPHEDVMPGPVADRLELMRATGANLEPILLVYDGGGDTAAVVDEVVAGAPTLATVTEDGLGQRVWAVSDPDLVGRVQRDLAPRQALIADGHHRWATYRRLQAERRAAGRGDGPWDRGLAMLVDSRTSPLRVAAIHRVVPDLLLDAALRPLEAVFRVRPAGEEIEDALATLTAADGAHPFVVTDGTTFQLVEEPDPAAVEAALPLDRPARWRSLDASVLHALVLERLWGLPDDTSPTQSPPEPPAPARAAAQEAVPAGTPRVEYLHDAGAAVRAARRRHGVAVLMRPVDVADVLALAAEGERMPRKSTSFGPKPRTGLVLRLLDD